MYEPSIALKFRALQAYSAVYKYLIPLDPAIASSRLWHNDLHSENIFVKQDDPTSIQCIIDWQSVSLAPLFDHTIQPGLLDHVGFSAQGTEIPPSPEDSEFFSEAEEAAATSLWYDKCLVIAFRIWVRETDKAVYGALTFSKTEAHAPLTLGRRLFEHEGALFLGSVANLQHQWDEIASIKDLGNPPFPIRFSDDKIREIEENAGAAKGAMEGMNKIKKALGDLFPEKGAVGHHRYDAAKEVLKRVKEQTFGHFVRTDNQRQAWERHWPFDG